jgi:hypothetical protein
MEEDEKAKQTVVIESFVRAVERLNDVPSEDGKMSFKEFFLKVNCIGYPEPNEVDLILMVEFLDFMNDQSDGLLYECLIASKFAVDNGVELSQEEFEQIRSEDPAVYREDEFVKKMGSKLFSDLPLRFATSGHGEKIGGFVEEDEEEADEMVSGGVGGATMNSDESGSGGGIVPTVENAAASPAAPDDGDDISSDDDSDIVHRVGKGNGDNAAAASAASAADYSSSDDDNLTGTVPRVGSPRKQKRYEEKEDAGGAESPRKEKTPRREVDSPREKKNSRPEKEGDDKVADSPRKKTNVIPAVQVLEEVAVPNKPIFGGKSFRRKRRIRKLTAKKRVKKSIKNNKLHKKTIKRYKMKGGSLWDWLGGLGVPTLIHGRGALATAGGALTASAGVVTAGLGLASGFSSTESFVDMFVNGIIALSVLYTISAESLTGSAVRRLSPFPTIQTDGRGIIRGHIANIFCNPSVLSILFRFPSFIAQYNGLQEGNYWRIILGELLFHQRDPQLSGAQVGEIQALQFVDEYVCFQFAFYYLERRTLTDGVHVLLEFFGYWGFLTREHIERLKDFITTTSSLMSAIIFIFSIVKMILMDPTTTRIALWYELFTACLYSRILKIIFKFVFGVFRSRQGTLHSLFNDIFPCCVKLLCYFIMQYLILSGNVGDDGFIPRLQGLLNDYVINYLASQSIITATSVISAAAVGTSIGTSVFLPSFSRNFIYNLFRPLKIYEFNDAMTELIQHCLYEPVAIELVLQWYTKKWEIVKKMRNAYNRRMVALISGNFVDQSYIGRTIHSFDQYLFEDYDDSKTKQYISDDYREFCKVFTNLENVNTFQSTYELGMSTAQINDWMKSNPTRLGDGTNVVLEPVAENRYEAYMGIRKINIGTAQLPPPPFAACFKTIPRSFVGRTGGGGGAGGAAGGAGEGIGGSAGGGAGQGIGGAGGAGQEIGGITTAAGGGGTSSSSIASQFAVGRGLAGARAATRALVGISTYLFGGEVTTNVKILQESIDLNDLLIQHLGVDVSKRYYRNFYNFEIYNRLTNINALTMNPMAEFNRDYHHIVLLPRSDENKLIDVDSFLNEDDVEKVNLKILEMGIYTLFVPLQEDTWYYFLYLHVLKTNHEIYFKSEEWNAQQQKGVAKINVDRFAMTGKVDHVHHPHEYLSPNEELHYSFLSHVLKTHGGGSLPISVVKSFLKLYVRA